MKPTKVFTRLSNAFIDGFRIIANKGGSRSSKTFSELQLIYVIMSESTKARMITVVSHSFPHLSGGAIRDFEKILLTEGIDVEKVRTKNPHIYKIRNSVLEFVGFDKPGKALGAARDILFINEANKMKFSVCHQLMQRTTELIMLDWNPSEIFWFEDEGVSERKDCITLISTYIDNIDNLTDGQIREFELAKAKAEKEDAEDRRGYWWNWWQVYGLGLHGQIEGCILDNWKYGKFDESLNHFYTLDFGFNPDPDAMCKVAYDHKNNKIYAKQLIYKTNNGTQDLITSIVAHVKPHELIIADSASPRTIEDIKKARFNIRRVRKIKTVADWLRSMQDYELIIEEGSLDLEKELMAYIWNDKKAGIPIDANNHLIDGIRYGFMETKGKGSGLRSRGTT